MGFHIVKRDNCPFWKKTLFYVIAIVAALAVGALILLLRDVPPMEYYTKMFQNYI